MPRRMSRPVAESQPLLGPHNVVPANAGNRSGRSRIETSSLACICINMAKNDACMQLYTTSMTLKSVNVLRRATLTHVHTARHGYSLTRVMILK
jgi:hypothetical protein